MISAAIHSKRTFSIALVALLGLGAIALFSGCTPEAVAEGKTYAGVNAIRAQYGMGPLAGDAGLAAVARARSLDMARNNYFSHSPPDGCNYVCLMDRFGVGHAWAGENIAWNTWDWSQSPDVTVQMWKNSPPHLDNILNCHYLRFGAGVARAADGKIYYTMVFEGNRAC